MILCSFSDFNLPLDCYPKHLKGKALHDWIYLAVSKRKRVSCFEITENSRMCRTLMFLKSIGKIKFENLEYPYTKISVVNR